MPGNFLNPSSKKTYQIFTVIIFAYLCSAAASVLLNYYDGYLPEWTYLLISNSLIWLNIASCFLIILVAKNARKSSLFVGWLFAQWLYTIYFAVVTRYTDATPFTGTVSGFIKINAVIVIAYYISLFFIRHPRLNRLVGLFATVHLMMIGFAFVIVFLPSGTGKFLLFLKILPVILLLCIAGVMQRVSKEDTIDEDFLGHLGPSSLP